LGDLHSTFLKGWRCRECGSWDVYAAILGEEQEAHYVVHKEKGESKCSSSGDGVVLLEDNNFSIPPSGKSGLNFALVTSLYQPILRVMRALGELYLFS